MNDHEIYFFIGQDDDGWLCRGCGWAGYPRWNREFAQINHDLVLSVDE